MLPCFIHYFKYRVIQFVECVLVWDWYITSTFNILIHGNDLTSAMQSSPDEPFNFVLLDGTWSNSAALYRRLKVQFNAFLIWHMHSLLLIRLSRLPVNTKVQMFCFSAGWCLQHVNYTDRLVPPVEFLHI